MRPHRKVTVTLVLNTDADPEGMIDPKWWWRRLIAFPDFQKSDVLEAMTHDPLKETE